MDEALIAELCTTELFKGVNAEWVRAHGPGLRRFAASPGEVLIEQGEAAGDVLVVLAGRVEVVYRDAGGAERVLTVLGPGDTVGEIALLTGGPRTSSVRTLTSAELVAVRETAFRQLLADHPGVATKLATAAGFRLRHTNLVADAFKHLGVTDREAVSEIEPLIEWMHLSSGEVLFSEGEAGDSAYVVLHGRLRVMAGAGSEERVLGEIGRGEMVGEMAVLDHEPRNATVFAVRDTHLARFPPVAVDVLLERFPQVILHVARTVLRRVRTSGPLRRAEEQLSVAVVPLGEPGPAQVFAGELTSALGRFGRSESLSSGRVDHLLGHDDIAQSSDTAPGSLRLLPWLHDLEQRCAFLVYEADPQPSAWTRRVLRQCDQVLFVAQAGDRPVVSAVEQQARSLLVGRARPKTALVVLHDPSTTLPRGTAEWLRERPADDVHHVRHGRSSDVDRVARILAGRGVSLVLSGGGARGFAHLGVLRALRESGVPVDLVAGTSIGSVIAMLPALEVPAADLVPTVQEHFRRLFDYTLPVASVISGKRITESLRSRLGSLGIEDLWLPYFCNSASLTRAVAVVHRRGPLASAVRASVSIPGVMPPVPFEGDLLVDGGVIDNLPAREMRRVNPRGTLIAVDVAPAIEGPTRAEHGEWLSGWNALWSRVRGKGHVPPLAQTVLRSMLVAANRDRDRVVADQVCDLYLDLNVLQCGPFDFEAVDATAAAGYQSAAPRIEAWLASYGTPWSP